MAPPATSSASRRAGMIAPSREIPAPDPNRAAGAAGAGSSGVPDSAAGCSRRGALSGAGASGVGPVGAGRCRCCGPGTRHRGRAMPGIGGLLREHVDGDRTRPRILTRPRTVRGAAQTRQPIGTGEDRRDRVRAALPLGARITIADSVGQLIQTGIADRGIGDTHPPPEGHHPVGVIPVTELDAPILGRSRRSDHRTRIEPVHPVIDGLDQTSLRQRPERGDTAGDPGIDERERVRVGDQPGAPGDRIDHRRRHQPLREHPRGAGQSVTQRLPYTHLLGRGPRTQIARRTDLGLRERPPIDQLMSADIVLVLALTSGHLGHQCQPPSRHPRLIPGRSRHRRDERLITHRRQSVSIRFFEHVFYHAVAD